MNRENNSAQPKSTKLEQLHSVKHLSGAIITKMRRKKYEKTIFAAALAVLCLSGCSKSGTDEDAVDSFSVEDMNRKLLSAAGELPHSDTLYFKDGIEITGLGMTYDGRPTEFDGCYYFPAIE